MVRFETLFDTMINKKTVFSSIALAATIGSATLIASQAFAQTPTEPQQSISDNTVDMAGQFFSLLVSFDPIRVDKILS